MVSVPTVAVLQSLKRSLYQLQKMLAFGDSLPTLDDILSVSGESKPLTARPITSERAERTGTATGNRTDKKKASETAPRLLYLGTSPGVPYHQEQVGNILNKSQELGHSLC